MKGGIFWLHIKKSAGISARSLLDPLYVDFKIEARVERPVCFIQSDPIYYNAILNNYRTPLGDYQFKRSLFAKKYLYPETFEDYFRFAFSREPKSRRISQFFYLWHDQSQQAKLRRFIYRAKKLDFQNAISWDFDRFLDAIAESRASSSSYAPYGLSFQTHVAGMYEDITDEKGAIILDRVFRLEDMHRAINAIRFDFGLNPVTNVRENKSLKLSFSPTREQNRKMEDLFAEDFNIYEGQCDRHISELGISG